MKRWIIYSVAVLSVASAFALSACNTFEGVGQDMQSGGRSIEEAADDNK